MSTKYIASNWRLPNQAGVDSYLNDNYGLTFDGSSEFIDLGNDSALTPENITISCWVNITNGGHINGYYVSKIHTTGSSATYGIFKKQPLFFVKTSSGFINSPQYGSSIVDAGWTHLVGTYDGSDVRLYVNGVEVGTGTAGSGAIDYTSEEAYIGAFEYYTPTSSLLLPIEGKISEVAIFDYALSSTQISTLYGSSSLGAGNPMALKPAPVAFYPLGDNSSGNPLTQPNEAVEDASVFDFDGTNEIEITETTLSGEFSISAWLNPDTFTAGQSMLFGGNSSNAYKIEFNGPTIINIKIAGSNTGIYSPTSWNLNEWQHLLITRNSSNLITIYRNGVSWSTTTKSGDFIFDRISGFNNSASHFDGEMSNIAIWNSDQSLEKDNIYNSGVPATTYTNTPTAWYKLDQSANWDVSGSGYWDIPDASGNGNDGISSGMTSANLVLTDLTRNLPFDSYSFSFDAASSDYLEISDNSAFQITDNLTVSAWVYPVNKSATNTIIDKFNVTSGGGSTAKTGWLARVQNSRFRIGLTNTAGTASVSYQTNTALSNNAWHHLVFTFNSTTNEVNQYINGVLDSASPHTKTDLIAVNTQPLRIGGGYNLNNFFDGKISNVSVFDEALTSTEVLKLYSNGMPQDLSSFTPAPIAWWTLGSNSFFNGTNFICKDLIGSNDGTSVNAGVDALQGNTPRSEANGTGTNQSIPENLVGTTKYSSNNSWSINQSESARVQDTP